MGRHGCQTIIASRSLERVSEAAAAVGWQTLLLLITHLLEGLSLPFPKENPRKNLPSLFFQASKKLVAATGQRCLPLSLDVRQPQTIMAAVEKALKEFERIDILINNAAGNFLCPASALSFNGFKTVMDIDTNGTFNTCKVLFEKCFRDHGGVIVNITATVGYRGQALQVHAGAAKAAIDAMTRHLAVEWGPSNIRVNSLAPGPIMGTEGFRLLGGEMAEKASYFEMIPLHRAGNKTEIAHSALYLASPLSSYMTGTTLVVDGGSWLTSPNNFSALLDVWAAGAKTNQ
ncbi:PREDICTED: peroxisomal 2,4-dienoyl-CoA reductase [Tinamus guttatus]|uniref:peroxisomal 2,4-dienoyl-CoA reductase n=1 Tax=Tinamus guttatus TaxID=94827 RepID=UPI00052F2856|nr:PREDICTED: peroxisomal 2,4-dienoyl-CoA reductase [Tinamus guttatus]